jgi:hypothetical protein
MTVLLKVQSDVMAPRWFQVKKTEVMTPLPRKKKSWPLLPTGTKLTS